MALEMFTWFQGVGVYMMCHTRFSKETVDPRWLKSLLTHYEDRWVANSVNFRAFGCSVDHMSSQKAISVLGGWFTERYRVEYPASYAITGIIQIRKKL